MMSYLLSFKTIKNINVELSIRKVICLTISDTYVALESCKDGWFSFSIDEQLAMNARSFVVTENELHKIKLQLGL